MAAITLHGPDTTRAIQPIGKQTPRLQTRTLVRSTPTLHPQSPSTTANPARLIRPAMRKQARDRLALRRGKRLQSAGYNFPEHEDTSAIGNMLVAMLDRFARRCSDAEIQLGRMRLQNAAQSAEMQVLRGRVEKLEALLPPTPRLATPPYHERDPRALPSTLQLQGPHYSDALAEAATVEVGRAVRMKAGERPRAMWTACKTEGVPHVRSELDRAGTERTYAHENAPATPRLRRPPSPKPPPTKSARFSPIDAPPVPTRSITSPHNLYNRNVRRDGRTSFEPREDGVHLEMRTHGPQAVTS